MQLAPNDSELPLYPPARKRGEKGAKRAPVGVPP